MTLSPVLAEVIRIVAYLLAIIIFVALNAAYLVWVERKEAGRIQRRIGPKEVGPWGLLQPVADGLKLMTKQLLTPDGADKPLFKMAPVLVMTPAIMCFVTIPFSDTLVARNLDLGLLAIFAFASVNILGLLLGAWGSRNKFAVMASARIVSQNVAYEIPMLLVAVTIVMISGSMNLHDIVTQQMGGFWHWNIFRFTASPLMPVAFVIFFICMLAETNRAPFDMAESESELVAGAFTEYPGMGFGVFFMGEYANVVVGSCLATVLFLGGWDSPVGAFPGVVWFIVKLYALLFTIVWIRWTYPRTTFFSLLNLSWKVLIPISFVNLIITSALLKVF